MNFHTHHHDPSGSSLPTFDLFAWRSAATNQTSPSSSLEAKRRQNTGWNERTRAKWKAANNTVDLEEKRAWTAREFKKNQFGLIPKLSKWNHCRLQKVQTQVWQLPLTLEEKKYMYGIFKAMIGDRPCNLNSNEFMSCISSYREQFFSTIEGIVAEEREWTWEKWHTLTFICCNCEKIYEREEN